MLTITSSMPYKALSPLRCRYHCSRDVRVIFTFILCIGTMLFLSNVYQLQSLQHQCICKVTKEDKQQTVDDEAPPVVCVYAQNLQTGFLKHVTNVFARIGFKQGTLNDNWDVLWVHKYPFADKILHNRLTSLKWHQKIKFLSHSLDSVKEFLMSDHEDDEKIPEEYFAKLMMVNHFPGGGLITNKVTLAMSGHSFIPRSFKMPQNKAELLEYIKVHPQNKWVQKSNKHRGVHIKTAEELNLTNPNSFIQEYIDNPYLIDGRMFDIGMYTTLTSIDPLRVYVHSTEWLIRFCPHEYHPFDPQDTDKYVISGNYIPIWKIDALSKSYNELKSSAKISLLTYMKHQGKDTAKLQHDIMSAIREVYLSKENHLIDTAIPYGYGSTRNFFEMVRFDFILDEHLNVYLLEVNLSPNLSSAHIPRNKLMYEEVVFSMLSLVGVAHQGTHDYAQRNTDEMNMQVSERDFSVFVDHCASQLCEDDCRLQICKLCTPCLKPSDVDTIKLAYLEHTNRKTWRRVFPHPFPNQEEARMWRRDNSSEYAALNNKNRLMTMWFLGMCLHDASWCS